MECYAAGILNNSDTQLIGKELARFLFSEGLPFRKMENQHLWDTLGRASTTYPEASVLTEWHPPNTFSASNYEEICALRGGPPQEGRPAETLSVDGWSAVHKHHVLNVLLTPQSTFFIGSIFSEERTPPPEITKWRSSARYSLIGRVERIGPTVKVLVTDSIPVVRKAWKLLRSQGSSLLPVVHDHHCCPAGSRLRTAAASPRCGGRQAPSPPGGTGPR